jgi:hypothetical protein
MESTSVVWHMVSRLLYSPATAHDLREKAHGAVVRRPLRPFGESGRQGRSRGCGRQERPASSAIAAIEIGFFVYVSTFLEISGPLAISPRRNPLFHRYDGVVPHFSAADLYRLEVNQ